MFILLSVLAGFSALAIITAGALALLRDSKGIQNRWFFALTASTATWVIANFIDSNIQNHWTDLALKIDFIASIFIAWTFLEFVNVLLAHRSKRLKQLEIRTPIRVVASVANGIIVIAIALGLVVESSISNKTVQIEYGSIFLPYVALLLFYFLYGFILLTLKRASVFGDDKKALNNIFGGIFIAFMANAATNLVFPFVISETATVKALNIIGYLGLLVFISAVYVAITRQRLFDIKLVVVRSLGYALSITVLASLYSSFSWLLTSRLFESSANNLLLESLNVALLLTVAISFAPLKRRFDRLTNNLFYKDAYDTQDILAELNRHVLSSVDVEPLLSRSADIINKHLKTSFCSIELRPTAYNQQRILGDTQNFSEEDILQLRNLTAPIKKRVILTEDLRESEHKLYKILNKYDIGAVSKMTYSVDYGLEGIGLILFGIKKSGNPFNQQDKRVIGIISSELTVATQNALRFEEIENFNVTLQEKVDDATRRLKRANDRLKTLDETKDEFISMASHQLRTPLTSVKGYVSMVLEGDAGPLNDMQKKLLEQSFISSQRMVFLIADLLNLSRLKTGKFVIEAVPTNLEEVIEGEVRQLKETAAGKKLTLVYNQPKTFPTLMLDETKIRQVIMNFVDNAIYYTPAGGKIEINLIEKSDSVEFTVTDNGIGVPAAEQHHLFNKFYRAKNAQKARPDGTGLGLFMAKKVIVAQGGALIFHSVVDKGSTFGFSFAKNKLQIPQSVKT